MKKIRKSKKQLERERELVREEKKKEITELYYVRKKRWEELGLDLSCGPFRSLEEFVKKELDKWEDEQLKIPTGKYLDTKKVTSIYQQKFVEYIRQLCPQVIEELREFVPHFERLFGEKKEKYLDIFSRFKMEIYDLDNSLDSKINYFIIKHNFLRFRPNKYHDYRYDYVWGEHRLLLHFLYFLFVRTEDTEKTNEIIQDMSKLLQNNLISDEIDKSALQNYLINGSSIIIKEFFSYDEHKHFREEAKQKITTFLQDISPTPEDNIADFIELQIGLLKWAERHNLHKDWLLRYAYFFLSQFSNNPDVKVDEIEIPHLNVRSFAAYPFEFSFNGWLPGDEEKEEYEKRIKESFESKLQTYFHQISNHFDLNEKKRITRPRSFENVKWLVYSTVKKWNAERILEKFFPDISANRTKNDYSFLTFENKLKHIKSEMRKLESFLLPVSKDS